MRLLRNHLVTDEMPTKNLAGLRILIVDDSAVVRGMIRKLLRDENEQMSVHEWCEGHGAVEKAHEVKPDVVLLDMSLPGVTGLELARRFREEFAAAQVVLMSQQDPAVLQQLTKLAGLQWCISKSELFAELPPMLEKFAAA
jgi:two-component system, NarL family, invasion response regulator UvrY